ncbi:NAD(P)/FAD-dependent oxidoreductase [Methyloglobulus sp.]|uniref:NAD(P)/FAD-dependent oxidoreductase n=1 Tax=Methyloglobulus sp. TaxID=2518622 RepID=UPI003989D114
MTTSTDITLIGGGIIGLLTARKFYNAGATVTVIDKGLLGKESSWAGGGILLPLYPWRQNQAITLLVKQSLGLYPALASQLSEETGIDPEWNPCGLLITQNPDITAATDWCNHNKITFEEAENMLDGLGTMAVHPLWLPHIAQIRNPRLIKSLKQDLLQKGVRLIENCQLSAINLDNNRVNSIATSIGNLLINELIITAGAWTSELLKQFFPTIRDNSPQISPVKGQMLLFAAKPDTLRTIVLDGDHYLIPRLDGNILAGSTVEGDTFDKSTTPEAKNQISAFALKLLPALKDYPLVKHWAGIRPGTQNGVPYIDRHPEINNLSINAGHFRNGLAMAPASAQLIADLILGRPTSVDPEPYRLNRLV